MRFLARILQALVLVALALGAVLWFAARRGDRGFINEEVTIARPPAAVFRWISSEDLARRWISGLVDLRRSDPGAKLPDFQLAEMIYGQRVVMTVQIVRVVPNQQLDLQISSGDFVRNGFTGDAEFRLTGTGDYTRLVFSSHTKFANTRDQICEPIWTYAAKYKMRDDLAKLKVLVEAEPANSTNFRSGSIGN